MTKLNLFKEINFKNDMANVIVGLIMTIFAVCLIVGYPLHIYDISHILLFMTAVCLWVIKF